MADGGGPTPTPPAATTSTEPPTEKTATPAATRVQKPAEPVEPTQAEIPDDTSSETSEEGAVTPGKKRRRHKSTAALQTKGVSARGQSKRTRSASLSGSSKRPPPSGTPDASKSSKPPTGSSRDPKSSRPPPSSSRQPPSSSRDPTSSRQQPGSSRDPTSSRQQPGSSRDPTSSRQQPGSSRDPTSSRQQPGSSRDPASSRQQPSSSRDPTSSRQQPSSSRPTGSSRSRDRDNSRSRTKSLGGNRSKGSISSSRPPARSARSSPPKRSPGPSRGTAAFPPKASKLPSITPEPDPPEPSPSTRRSSRTPTTSAGPRRTSRTSRSSYSPSSSGAGRKPSQYDYEYNNKSGSLSVPSRRKHRSLGTGRSNVLGKALTSLPVTQAALPYCNPCMCWRTAARCGLKYWATWISIALIAVGLINLIELADIPSGFWCGLVYFDGKAILEEYFRVNYTNASPQERQAISSSMSYVDEHCVGELTPFMYGILVFSSMSVLAGLAIFITRSTGPRAWLAYISAVLIFVDVVAYIFQSAFNYQIAAARQVYFIPLASRRTVLIVHIVIQCFLVLVLYAYFTCCICLYGLQLKKEEKAILDAEFRSKRGHKQSRAPSSKQSVYPGDPYSSSGLGADESLTSAKKQKRKRKHKSMSGGPSTSQRGTKEASRSRRPSPSVPSRTDGSGRGRGRVGPSSKN